jgi:NAD(P)-dependent dehydrogenase (short-subunit alcohol dehydrogenase family)
VNEQHSRIVLITGAAGGIGRALVQEFHAANYAVIATDRMVKPADLPCTHYFQADLAQTVSDAEYGNRVLEEVKSAIGSNGLHALVNNAAIQILGGTDALSRDDWQHTLNVNLLAPFFWAQALLPELETAKGCIVNISSIHARLTKKNFVAYATSKAALSGMTRAMAVDLGPRVRVNAIEPAAIETEMLKAGFENEQELFQLLKNCHPQHRIGQSAEVARLAFAIVAGGINFMHGTAVGLDGGIGACLFDPS